MCHGDWQLWHCQGWCRPASRDRRLRMSGLRGQEDLWVDCPKLASKSLHPFKSHGQLRNHCSRRHICIEFVNKSNPDTRSQIKSAGILDEHDLFPGQASVQHHCIVEFVRERWVRSQRQENMCLLDPSCFKNSVSRLTGALHGNFGEF